MYVFLIVGLIMLLIFFVVYLLLENYNKNKYIIELEEKVYTLDTISKKYKKSLDFYKDYYDNSNI
jgi:hypothetical protein|uniref:Uncharacterized protein n=1 Tax=Podoviridae sp. ctQyH19 TaxID=2825249 RepID=A0A8S5UQW4_9CAUD|nr:MAG TPA: protein of unknown function (DUF4083) [Podoviridae sp. ctQyH19]